MKRLLTSVASLLALSWLLNSCVTENIEGRLLASTAQTVDATMKGWAIWVVDGNASEYAEARVKGAYGRYQLAMDAAKAAYLAWHKTGEKDTWEQASATLKASRDSLLKLIESFQVPPGQRPTPTPMPPTPTPVK
jgi:hypothetical protein